MAFTKCVTYCGYSIISQFQAIYGLNEVCDVLRLQYNSFISGNTWPFEVRDVLRPQYNFSLLGNTWPFEVRDVLWLQYNFSVSGNSWSLRST